MIPTFRTCFCRLGLAASLAVLPAAVAAPALAQGTAAPARTGAPARGPAPPQPQTAAQASPFTSLGQVCQLRERELVAINSQLVLRGQAAGREPDQQKRAQLLAPIEQLRANLRETEASWQRMDCVRLLYGR